MSEVQGRIFKLEFVSDTLCYFGFFIVPAYARRTAAPIADDDNEPLRVVYGKLDLATNEIVFDQTQSTCNEDIVQPSLYLTSRFDVLQKSLCTELINQVNSIKALSELKTA